MVLSSTAVPKWLQLYLIGAGKPLEVSFGVSQVHASSFASADLTLVLGFSDEHGR